MDNRGLMNFINILCQASSHCAITYEIQALIASYSMIPIMLLSDYLMDD